MPRYFLRSIPSVILENASPDSIIRSLNDAATSVELQKYGYRGISIARSNKVTNSDGPRNPASSTISARLESLPFVALVEFVAKNLSCYITEESGMVVLVPVEVVDANSSACALPLTDNVKRALGISTSMSEDALLDRLARYKLLVPSGSSARFSDDEKFLVFRSTQDAVQLAKSFFALVDRVLRVEQER